MKPWQSAGVFVKILRKWPLVACAPLACRLAMSVVLAYDTSAWQARLVGADQSHAWYSLYCGPETGWIDFDPTNNCICNKDHIPIAWGRDYQDVVPVRGVFLGGGNHTLKVSVDVMPIE